MAENRSKTFYEGDDRQVYSLYITGIPTEFTTHTLRNLFATYGKVVASKILNAKEPGKPRAGFVEYRSRSECDNAIRQLNRIQFGSSQLKVEYAKPRETSTFKAVLPQKSIMSLLEKLELGPLVEKDLQQLTKNLEHEHCPNISSTWDIEDHKSLGKTNDGDVYSVNRCNVKEIEPKFDDTRSHTKKLCFICKKKSSTFCGECRTVYYCSRVCQNEDWASHKVICKKIDQIKAHNDISTLNNDQPLVYVGDTETSSVKTMLSKFKEDKAQTVPLILSSQPFKIGDTKDMNVMDLEITSGTIYCQELQPKSNISLDDLQEKLKKWFEATERPQLCDLKVGSVGAAIFSEDNQWYRVQINDIEGETAIVCFLDYGNCERKATEQLKVLPEEFFLYPPFVVGVKLADVEVSEGWSDEAVRVFTSYLQQTTRITVSVKEVVGSEIFADVFCGEVCFNREIVKNKWMAAKLKSVDVNHNLIKDLVVEKVIKMPNTNLSVEDSSLNQTSQNPNINVSTTAIPISEVILTQDDLPKDTFSLVITSVTDPNNFYFQIVKESLVVLNEYLSDLTSVCSENRGGDLCVHKPGLICAVLFEEDSMWYRGKILKTSEENVKVLLVDYGNIENVSPKNIRALPSQFHSLPIQAYNASLSDCYMVNDNWPTEAIDALKACQDNALSANLVSFQDNLAFVTIFIDSNTTLQQYFIANKLAAKEPTKCLEQEIEQIPISKIGIPKSTKQVPQCIDKLLVVQPEKGEIISINITSCLKAGRFSCQLVTDHLIELSDMLVKLTACCNDLPKGTFTNLVPRAICAAFYEEDQCWYRACILSINEGKFLVEYIDYGNTSIVTIDEILALPVEFRSLPVQGLKCSLSNMEALGEGWSNDYITVVNSCIGEPLDAKFVGKYKGQYSVLAPKLINLLVTHKCGEFCFK